MNASKSEILDRQPPCSLDAERAVLGSILIDPRVLDDVASILRADDFYADAHRTLYSRMLDMHRRDRRIDTTLLVEELQRNGELEAIGGPAYVAEIVQAVPVAAYATYYAQIVKDKAKLREVIGAGLEMVQAGYAATDDADQIVDQAESRLLTLRAQDQRSRPGTLEETAIEVMARIDAIRHHKAHAGIFTGLESFDQGTGGLFRGELFVLAARPGIGKTSLALQIAHHVATSGRLVYFASLEMSRQELTSRLLCSLSGVSSQRVRNGHVDDQDRRQLVQVSNHLPGSTLVIDDRASMTVADIHRNARRHSGKKGLALVVVDYLQRLTPHDRRVQRHEQVGAMTDALKARARELDVAVLCLCQLNREAAKDGQPQLWQLRESGSIEQDADVVAFLVRQYNAGMIDASGADRQAELRIAKNRNGECGAYRLTWEPETTTFRCGHWPTNGAKGVADEPYDEFAEFAQ